MVLDQPARPDRPVKLERKGRLDFPALMVQGQPGRLDPSALVQQGLKGLRGQPEHKAKLAARA